ncbi:MAG: FAD-binding oxidoreductase [Proteobacteria bacterium]|nr:FAD-binding oxidoreductase [Pseudomonadota bacterium]
MRAPDNSDAEQGFEQSLWSNTAEPAPATENLKNNEQADVVIVGAGFTGLSAALHLAEAGKSVAVLEARDIGWGGSGRNGGQVNPAFKVLPSEMRALFGLERANRILEFADGAPERVFDLIERHDIKCAPRQVPYMRGAYGRRGLKQVEDWVREWGEFGSKVSMKSAQETQEIMGTDFFHGGMEDSRGGSLQPLSYVRGLARAALKAGAQIYTNSPATKVAKNGSSLQVTTANGATVDAEYFLTGCNGYTDDLWPGLKRNIVPVASLQSATEPLPEALRQKILPRGHHVSETRRVMTYFRIDETGRFQIGGRGSPFNPLRQRDNTEHLRKEAIRIYPELKEVRWEYDWGGLVAATKTHLPHLIRLESNAYAGLGYNGRGVAMGTAMGTQLAGVVLGEDVALPQTSGVPFLLHPFRNLGITWQMLTGSLLDRFDG